MDELTLFPEKPHWRVGPTPEQSARLARCERTIEDGLREYNAVRRALRQIADHRLYRWNAKSFTDYCQQRWKLPNPRG